MTASVGAVGEHVERLLAVLGQGHIMVLESQSPLERPPDGRLVVNHQYARHGVNDRVNA